MAEQLNQSLKSNDSTVLKGEDSSITDENKSYEQRDAKWINNQDEAVEQVFGFNENSELVNGRAAMIGFFMLVLTELIFHGAPVTHSIFAIN